MNLNIGKCYLLIFGHKHDHQWAQEGKSMVWKKNKVKRLGKTTDNELIFDSHILNICSKANKKLSVLCNLKIFQQPRVLFKSFFEAQFKYYPLI